MPDGLTLCKPKIERKPWSAERLEQLQTLFDAGLSCREIGRELGCTKNAVSGKISRLGLNRQPELPSFEERVGWDRVVATGCRWVEGDPRKDWHWCGAPQEAHKPYCADHMRSAWHKAS
jgi:hypothetical protein